MKEKTMETNEFCEHGVFTEWLCLECKEKTNINIDDLVKGVPMPNGYPVGFPEKKTNSHGSGSSGNEETTNPSLPVTHLEKLRERLDYFVSTNPKDILNYFCEAILKDDLENKEQDKNVRYLLMIENIRRGMKLRK